MASSLQHQLINGDRVSSGSMYSTQTRPGGSKCQMCLHKILRIITTVPPPLPPTSSPRFSASDIKQSTADNDSNGGNKRSRFDLNDGFYASPETVEFLETDDAGWTSSSTTGVPESVNFDGGGDRTEKEESGNNVSENGSSVIEIEETGDRLTLLVEAAKLIFGEFEKDKRDSGPESGNQSISRVFELKKDNEAAADTKPPNERQLRRRSNWRTEAETGGEFDEAPVVRSKRGRTRVLPSKYRDSVLEPLTQLSRNRSSILPTKRKRM